MRSFNVSYSSLGIVRTFPFDRIKFDQPLTLEVNQDHPATVIVRTVLTFGRIQSIAMLADAVDTADRFEILKWEGCDAVQGFLLGKS